MPLNKSQILALNSIRAMIDSQPSKRNKISILASKTKLSEFQLTNGFKELYGETIYNYQLKLSMNHAATLLQNGMTVKAVSIELGYKVPNNFTRAFTKMFKYPPLVVKNEAAVQ